MSIQLYSSVNDLVRLLGSMKIIAILTSCQLFGSLYAKFYGTIFSKNEVDEFLWSTFLIKHYN